MEKKKEVITQFDRQTGCTMKMFNDGTKITAQLPSQCCESIIVSKNKITAVPETETSSQVSICKKTSIKVKLWQENGRRLDVNNIYSDMFYD